MASHAARVAVLLLLWQLGDDHGQPDAMPGKAVLGDVRDMGHKLWPSQQRETCCRCCFAKYEAIYTFFLETHYTSM